MSAAKKILTLDLGNTVLNCGVWENEELPRPWWSIPVSRNTFRSELRNIVCDLKKVGNIDLAILASVVPKKTDLLLSLCRDQLGVDCILLSARTPTGLKILYDRPEQVGADRIANSVGAYHLFGGPVIVVDFGTAITFDVVSENCEYLGGVIAPGLEISTRALFQQAALLPRVEISVPGTILGRDTASAICSGVFYGTQGLVKRIIQELKKELGWGNETKLVATGGQAGLILSRSELIKTVDPLLTMKGLYLIAERL